VLSAICSGAETTSTRNEILVSAPGSTDGSRTTKRTRRGSRSLRQALTARILLVGLAAMTASLAMVGVQIQHSASQEADTAVQAQADRSAANISALFDAWRDELLVASSNAALTDWFTHPERRATLQAAVDGQLMRLHSIYPKLIDEACFISFQGPELARATKGVVAGPADLSPDESTNAFFTPTLAMGPGQVWQNPPYLSVDSHRWVISNSTPIMVNGRKAALLHFEANLDAVRTRIAEGLDRSLRARVIDTRTHTVIADTSSTVPIVSDPLAKVSSWRGAAGPVRSNATVAVDKARNGNHWIVQVSGPAARPFTATLLFRAGLVVGLALLGIAAVALNFASGIARPVTEVTEVAESLARGDLSRRTSISRRDEIGRMATAVNEAVAGMLKQQDDLRAAGDARQRQLKESHRQQEMSDQQIRVRAQAVIDETAETVLGELTEVVNRVDQVRSGADTIDNRASQTSSVTSALVEQAAAADRLVATLGESLRRVGGIADTIGGVAGQTHLLALNATIEAARAGEAGAGFSVVAHEVKELAANTAGSSAEITSTIRALEEDASAVASAITRMAADVANIDSVTAEVISVTAEQQASVARLNSSVNDAITRIKGLADITDGLDRRESERYSIESDTGLVLNGTDYPVRLRDISETGMGCVVQGNLPLSIADTVEVRCAVDGEEMRLAATVVRVSHDGPDCTLGMRWANPSPPDIARIRRLISSHFGMDVAALAGK
jgi:methyl-accepting chemotaxis protein